MFEPKNIKLIVDEEATNSGRITVQFLFNSLERSITMQTELLKVTGMTCGGCTSNVTKVLKAINGVGDVEVSLAAGEATVQFDERLTSLEQLKAAVKGAGYSVDAQGTAQKPQGKGGCCG
jgi:copper chaperone CopZ